MTNAARNDPERTRLLPATPGNPLRRRPGRSWCRRIASIVAAMVVLGAGLAPPAGAAEGDLDPAFGVGGKVVTDFLVEVAPGFEVGAFDGATAVALQADGKIVAAGFTSNADFNIILAVVRYNADGSLDSGFGTGGIARLEFFPLGFFPEDRDAVDVAIQADGRIVVAGTVAPGGGPSVFGVARLDTDGSLDPGFGGGSGWVTTGVGSYGGGTSLAIQADGKIVVAGWAAGVGGYADFVLVRYDSGGALDTAGFGGGTGVVVTDFSGYEDFANGVAIQADGRIVAVGGAAPDATFRRDFALARYDSSGTLDTATFGAGTGKVVTDMSGTNDWDVAKALALQADGMIVVAGGAVVYNGACGCTHFALARYDTTGTLDPGFGVGGKLTDDFVGGGDFANDVEIQADGKIVAAGLVQYASDVELHVDFGIARYGADGIPDPTFGTGGKVTTSFQGIDVAHGIAIQSDCRIVAAGYTWVVEDSEFGEFFNGESNFSLARYEGPSCSPPPAARCPKSQGYWKNHVAAWPTASLTLGGAAYTQAELLALLKASSQGDASLILARQLIAAKLNLANGADSAPVGTVIADADALLAGYAGKLPYGVQPSAAAGQAMVAGASVLESYNAALLTPECSP